MDKIEETRKYLIEKYGEPVEKILPDGKKYSFVNMDLKNFDNLIMVFKKLTMMYNVELKSEHINVLCDFAKTGVQQNVENVVKKLNRYIKDKERNVGFGRKPFLRLLNELEELYNDEKYNTNCIMDIFVNCTKCADVRKKENFREAILN